MEDTKIVNVPINSDMQLTIEDCPVSTKGKLDMKVVPFQELVGALNWLAVGTQPNIAFVVG